MVFFTAALCVRQKFYSIVRPKMDPYWRKRQILKISANMYGRNRNCFSIAIRRVQKALLFATKGRKMRKATYRELWNERIDAGAKELGHMPEGSRTVREALAIANVQLNTQTLSNLAIWEPRTFACIDKIAAAKAREEKIARYLGPFPKGILGKL